MLILPFDSSDAFFGKWIILAKLSLLFFGIILLVRYRKFCKIRDYLIENNIQYLEEKEANQRVDLTVKTPVESGNEQGTAGHP